MKINVIFSEEDEASMNIYKHMKEISQAILTKKEPVYFDEETGSDLLIFATKHFSKNGTPGFSCHVSGNWGRAELGGEEKDFSVAPCFLLKMTMDELSRTGHEFFQEVTHHGPCTNIPSVFIEIGSREDEWNKEENGRIIADIIRRLLEYLGGFDSYYDFEEHLRKNNPNTKTAIGIGGLHHTPSFKKLITQGKIALGHTCAKYNLDVLSEETLLRAIEKTKEDIDIIVVDYKGLGPHKEKVKNILKKIEKDKGIPWKKTKDV